jgi:hypothetical protein
MFELPKFIMKKSKCSIHDFMNLLPDSKVQMQFLRELEFLERVYLFCVLVLVFVMREWYVLIAVF